MDLWVCLEFQDTYNVALTIPTWTSKRAQNNGPISPNRDYRQYRVRYFGHFGGPGTSQLYLGELMPTRLGDLASRQSALRPLGHDIPQPPT